VIREVSGFAPYERRIVELLKISKDKRALRVAKKRVRIFLSDSCISFGVLLLGRSKCLVCVFIYV
jgi:hypothetical protein